MLEQLTEFELHYKGTQTALKTMLLCFPQHNSILSSRSMNIESKTYNDNENANPTIKTKQKQDKVYKPMDS